MVKIYRAISVLFYIQDGLVKIKVSYEHVEQIKIAPYNF